MALPVAIRAVTLASGGSDNDEQAIQFLLTTMTALLRHTLSHDYGDEQQLGQQ
jgi:hypothetical protein